MSDFLTYAHSRLDRPPRVLRRYAAAHRSGSRVFAICDAQNQDERDRTARLLVQLRSKGFDVRRTA